MSELHKFLFEGLPVRGAVVQLTDAWQEILKRQSSNTQRRAYPDSVASLLGEITAAAVLMQSNIKFDGALILQIFGDGPVKLAVAEVKSDLSLRSTATVVGEVAQGATLREMVNLSHHGRCSITLDPQNRFPGQQPYQGVVSLSDDSEEPFTKISDVLEHYMKQSEQLDTTLVLAADSTKAAGLLIQRLPMEGENNLMGRLGVTENAHALGLHAHYQRISILAKSLTAKELLGLDVDTILRRLFWEESVTRLPTGTTESTPRFACSCNRERVAKMIVGLGRDEVASIFSERSDIEVSCEFCGMQYRFDVVDTTQLFAEPFPFPSDATNPH